MLAMCRAVAGLNVRPELALIDGNATPKGLSCAARTVVDGDAKCLSIAAASIVAKVFRDAYMRKLAERFPVTAGRPTSVTARATIATRWRRLG